MQVIQVTDKQTVNEFHKLPEIIYKNDPNWTPQLRLMVEEIFDPKKIQNSKPVTPVAGL